MDKSENFKTFNLKKKLGPICKTEKFGSKKFFLEKTKLQINK